MEPGQLEKEELGRNRSEISRKSSRESVCLSRKSSGEGFEGVYGAEKVNSFPPFYQRWKAKQLCPGEPKEQQQHEQASQQTL